MAYLFTRARRLYFKPPAGVPVSSSNSWRDLPRLIAGSAQGSRWGELVAMSLLYLVLALIATYPLIRSIDSAVAGGGDTAQNLWNLWWMSRAMRQGSILPFYTSILYHPTSISLAQHTLTPLSGWQGVVPLVGLGFNLATTYNLLTLASFVLTGLATYYLVLAIAGSRTAAFSSSLIFTFAPVRISRVVVGHLNLFSTQFVVLTTLFTVVLLQSGRRRFGVLAGVALAATAWTSLELALGTGMLVAMVVALTLIATRDGRRAYVRRLAKPLSIFAVTALFLVLPILWPMVRDLTDFADQSDQSWASEYNSADLVGFVVPDQMTASVVTRLSPRLTFLFQETYSRFYGNPAEKTVFIGYVVIGLLVFTLLTALSREVRTWLLIAGVFFILSLGPVLHVLGEPVLDRMPYAWLNEIPLVGVGRTPSRYALFLMLALAVVIGCGLASLESRRPKTRFFTPVLGLLVFIEFLAIPIRMDTRISFIPAYYYEMAATEDTAAAVLEVPIDLYGAQGPASDYMLYQTVHQRPIVGGYISRTPSKALWPFERPFLNELRARIYGDTAPYHFSQEVLAQAADDLRLLDVTYVVLHKDELSEQDFETIRTALDAVISAPYYDSDRLTAWKLDQQP